MQHPACFDCRQVDLVMIPIDRTPGQTDQIVKPVYDICAYMQALSFTELPRGAIVEKWPKLKHYARRKGTQSSSSDLQLCAPRQRTLPPDVQFSDGFA